MTADIWKEQILYFSSRGFRVIALDPRSQGLTTKTESGNTYQQQAADLHAFLQALKIEHSYLVGYGSGVLALLDYISSPEALKPEKMVFVDGSPAALKSEDYPGLDNHSAGPQTCAFAGGEQGQGHGAVRSFFIQAASGGIPDYRDDGKHHENALIGRTGALF